MHHQYMHQHEHISPIITSSVGSLLHLVGSVCRGWLGLFHNGLGYLWDCRSLPDIWPLPFTSFAQCCFLGRAWKFQYCNVSSSQIVLASIKQYLETRSLRPLRGPTSSWQPFGPAFGPSGLVDFVLRTLRALRPCDPRNSAFCYALSFEEKSS